MVEIKSKLTPELLSFLRLKSNWCDYLVSAELENVTNSLTYKSLHVHALYSDSLDAVIGLTIYTYVVNPSLRLSDGLDIDILHRGVYGVSSYLYENIFDVSVKGSCILTTSQDYTNSGRYSNV